MLKKLTAAAIFVLTALIGLPAQAAYPDKPVKIIVANPPGGPVDVMLRVLATRLSEVWGQPVVVENRPGGSGIVSTSALVKSAPDGYTLGMVVASAVTIMPFAVQSLPYDPIKDLQPITLVARTPFIFVVANDSPIKTWQDFVDASKKKELTIGSYAVGSAFHLIWEQTARKVGIKALYAPANAASKTQGDLISGLLDIAFEAPSSAKGMLDSGRIRAIAITSPQRFPGLPDTPTLSESGMPGYSSQPWFGLFAPAGTPMPVVDTIQQTVAKVLQEPEMQKRLQSFGMVAVGSTPQELAKTVQEDRQAMEPLVKELGIKLQ